jgi:hypothetical protein
MKDYVTVRALVRARAVDDKAATNPVRWVVHESAMEGGYYRDRVRHARRGQG